MPRGRPGCGLRVSHGGERAAAVPGYQRLAVAHMLNKETDLALSTLQNGLKVDPRSKELLQALARVYAFRKDYAAAEQMRRVVEIDPNDVAAQAAV